MTMNRAEVAFVAFDAQDVIATSGGPPFCMRKDVFKSFDTVGPYYQIGTDMSTGNDVYVFLYNTIDREYFTFDSVYWYGYDGDDNYDVYITSYNVPTGTLVGYNDSRLIEWLRSYQ